MKLSINNNISNLICAMESNKNKSSSRTTTRSRKTKQTTSEPSTSSKENGDVQKYDEEETDYVRNKITSDSQNKVCFLVHFTFILLKYNLGYLLVMWTGDPTHILLPNEKFHASIRATGPLIQCTPFDIFLSLPQHFFTCFGPKTPSIYGIYGHIYLFIYL